jgi:hypothetical protein
MHSFNKKENLSSSRKESNFYSESRFSCKNEKEKRNIPISWRSSLLCARLALAESDICKR